MSSPMKPNQSLLIKLGSALVHFEEFIETDCHTDFVTAQSIMKDQEVVTWLGEMNAKALLPVKRSG